MERAYLTVRATGKRIYLDDDEPAQALAVKQWLASGSEGPLTFVCDLCEQSRPSHEFRQEDLGGEYLICFHCGNARTGLKFHVPWEDGRFLGQAHGALKALRSEVKNG